MGLKFGRNSAFLPLQQQIVPLLFAIVPGLAMVAPLGLAPLLAVVAVLAGAANGIAAARRQLADAGLPLPLLALALLLAWSGLTAVWAPDPAFAALSFARSVACAAAGWWLAVAVAGRQLPPSMPRLLATGLAAAASLLLLVEIAERSLLALNVGWAGSAVKAVTHMDRGATVCVLFLWPAMLGLLRDGARWPALGLLVVVVAACGLSHDAAAKVGLLLGGAAIAWATWMPRSVAWMIGAGMALAVLCAPLIAARIPPPAETLHWHWLMPTAHHRLTIWRFAAQSIAAKPVFGAGLEASRQIDEGRHLTLTDDFGHPRDEQLMPLHPHDAALQLWLELGAVGAILAAGFLFAIGRGLAVHPATSGAPAAAAPAMLAAAFFFASVSYGIWQSWWHAALWLAFGLWRGLPTPRWLDGQASGMATP